MALLVGSAQTREGGAGIKTITGRASINLTSSSPTQAWGTSNSTELSISLFCLWNRSCSVYRKPLVRINNYKGWGRAEAGIEPAGTARQGTASPSGTVPLHFTHLKHISAPLLLLEHQNNCFINFTKQGLNQNKVVTFNINKKGIKMKWWGPEMTRIFPLTWTFLHRSIFHFYVVYKKPHQASLQCLLPDKSPNAALSPK